MNPIWSFFGHSGYQFAVGGVSDVSATACWRAHQLFKSAAGAGSPARAIDFASAEHRDMFKADP